MSSSLSIRDNSLTSQTIGNNAVQSNRGALVKPSNSTNLTDFNQPNGIVDQQLGFNSCESNQNVKSKKREVYRYETNWLVSSLAWSNEASDSFELALGSYIESYSNFIQLITLNKDAFNEEIQCKNTFEHPYPATKILWEPKNQMSLGQSKLLATTADYLRLWRVDNHPDRETKVKLECLLGSNRASKLFAPLTSFDWNEVDSRIIVTASVNTTCAVWDIETHKNIDNTNATAPSHSNSISFNLRSQLVAHDHQVYDVSFSRSGNGRDVFVSAGGDGSVRLFDLRRLDTSIVLYEESTYFNGQRRPLVRVECSKQDPNLLAAFAIDTKDILLLDIRNPGRPLAILGNHTAQLNSISWAPHSAHHICSASDDRQALIWNLSKLPEPISEPLLAYRANGKLNVINWSTSHPDWIAIGYENFIELLRV